MVQLKLNVGGSARFAIMLRTGCLAVDMATDRPATYAHRSSATRAMLRAPSWMTKWAHVVPVTYYTAEEDHQGNGLETYVVHDRDPALDTQHGQSKPAGSQLYSWDEK